MDKKLTLNNTINVGKNKKAQINLDTLCTIQKSLVDKYNIVYEHYKEVR